MTKETFEQKMLNQLREEILRHPAMLQEDAVKFVFQGMLGVGHLLSSRENVTAYVTREMDGQQADPTEPLFETLSPAWCRMNLRKAKAEGIPPEVIAGMMLSSGEGAPFSRQDVYDTCRRLLSDRCAGNRISEEKDLKTILDKSWVPSHSPAYRTQYHPAYRVVSAEWIPCMEAVRQIAQTGGKKERVLITLDGPCASGKTTMAEKLADVLQGEVVHTDDFVIPHSKKTSERLACPGGNCDVERLTEEVIVPFCHGDPVQYHRYSCMKDSLLPEEQLPATRFLFLEGSYSNLPAIHEYADVRLFLDAPWETREARLLARESPASMQQFYDLWIPLENAYFAAYHLPDEDCILISGDFIQPIQNDA